MFQSIFMYLYLRDLYIRFQKQLQQKIKDNIYNGTIPAGILFEEEDDKESEFDYENWKSWSPEEWIRWSNSKEYKEKYLNVLNAYRYVIDCSYMM